MKQERVLLACAPRLLSECLEKALHESCEVPHVVQARSWEQLVPLAASLDISYALVVVPFPGLNDFANWSEFKALHPTVPVTFLVESMEEWLWKVWRNQPISMLHLDSHIEDIVLAVEGMRKSLLVLSTHPAWVKLRQSGEGRQPGGRTTTSILSDMEIKVLQGFADGLTEKEVAKFLGIGHRTVQSYAASTRRKFGGDRVQVVLTAFQSGLITFPNN